MPKRTSHTGYALDIISMKVPVSQEDPESEVVEVKIFSFTDPKTMDKEDFVVSQEAGERAATSLIQRRVEPASALAGPDGRPIDLRKMPEGS